MLAFIDESGDSGFKLDSGSSPFFTIALVVFTDLEEATACDNRIELLKRELGRLSNSEFHFKNNSKEVRTAFINAVMPYNFFYYGFVLNKRSQRLVGDGFKDKKSFYKYTSSLVFENARERLDAATVIIDESGNADFKKQLGKYLKQKVNTGTGNYIKKIKMQKSGSNNLLQLADYVAGSINRSMLNKNDNDYYRKLLSLREIRVQVWPK